MGFDVGEAGGWILLQLALDEARLVDPGHAHRLGHHDPAVASELVQIAAHRRQLETMTPAEVREFAARYSHRPGYREEWRPARVTSGATRREAEV